MRSLLIVLLVGSTASAETIAPPARDLTVGEVKAEVMPHSDAIGACYVGAGAAGELRIVLTVSRQGAVRELDVVTPGLPAKQAKRIDSCIRPLLHDVKFPARKTTTTATLPFYYQRTAAPGAGPQPSCWDAKGCR